jgi:hypothetical protein
VPHLYCFSKYVVPKPPDWSEEIHITGTIPLGALYSEVGLLLKIPS